MLNDSYGRQIQDLRISVTDRCNFRCVYCKSADPVHYARTDGVSLDEYARLARIFVGLGIRKVRVTGGEPLLRTGIESFIEQLSSIEGLEDRAITTNGWLLADKAHALARAGLTRVNISMDSVHREKFQRITLTDGYDRVISGIEAVQDAGLHPVKVNVVLVRGFNDDEIVDFATFARARDVVLRFIEYMPLDADRHWSADMVVPAAEVVEKIGAVYPLVPIGREVPSSTARRFRFADGAPGEIGVVAPVTQSFCGHCSRIRLTSDAKIRTCLFSMLDHDLKPLLRSGASDQQIEDFIIRVTLLKEERHHINEPDFVQPERTMVFIGG
jgi:GTP 3',8-cyclase